MPHQPQNENAPRKDHLLPCVRACGPLAVPAEGLACATVEEYELDGPTSSIYHPRLLGDLVFLCFVRILQSNQLVLLISAQLIFASFCSCSHLLVFLTLVVVVHLPMRVWPVIHPSPVRLTCSWSGFLLAPAFGLWSSCSGPCSFWPASPSLRLPASLVFSDQLARSRCHS